MKLQSITLGQAIHVKHGFAFKGVHFVAEGEHIVLTPGNFHEIGGFRARPGKDRFYSGDIPDDYILRQGDLIVAMTEQGAGLLGSSARVPEDGRYLHNQRIGFVDHIDETKLHRGFLYHLFNTTQVRGQISGSATGTKVRHTAPERIYRVRVEVPDVEHQRKIAETLDRYEELITNNNRRIELLEQSARLLFKEWFVHLRYPGHEHDKIVDGVPEGWIRETIANLAETIGGGTPETGVSTYWEGGDITWFVPTDITRNGCLILLDSERKITEAGLKGSSAKILPKESILMTSRASVGFFGLFDEGACCTNQGFISITPKHPASRYYMLHNLMWRREEIISKAGGATYKEINKTTFRNMTMVLAAEKLRREFETFCNDVFRQVRNLKRQTMKLEAARDLLLPRLMDGRISL